MNVLFAAAEMSPLAKVGGLGDVAGSLPRALRAQGDDVRVAMPFYASIDRGALSLERLADVTTPWPGGDEPAIVWRTETRGVPVYLLESERFFGRPNVYGYDDDRDRFLFFCDALLAAAPHLGFAPDVVHAQDWHSAFLLTRLVAGEHQWGRCGRVYTIHNLALQGNFDRGFAAHYKIPESSLEPPAGADAGALESAMAQGIMHAHRVNTVSETYAKEILTPEFGAGLDGLLRYRGDAVSGIVNGIDYEEFDPMTDPHLMAHYSADNLRPRAENKRELQRRAGLAQREDAILFGVVTRLFAQKGIDLVPAALRPLVERGDVVQLVVLGTGDEDVHQHLLELQSRTPANVKIWLEFNPALGQLIYGGCDAFLMPSRYEPCGLGQLISLRYGAVPVVRRTGGLADTVEDVDPALRGGTGFVFGPADVDSLQVACSRAQNSFRDREGWRGVQMRGMRQDWSWERAAGKYTALYETAKQEAS